MSASSSNLIPKMDEPRFKTVVDFVRSQPQGTKFSFDGVRGSAKSKLCMHPVAAEKQMDCMDIALEAKELFGLMQRLNFFCQLPQDPSKTHITCEHIPQK